MGAVSLHQTLIVIVTEFTYCRKVIDIFRHTEASRESQRCRRRDPAIVFEEIGTSYGSRYQTKDKEASPMRIQYQYWTWANRYAELTLGY